MADVRVKVWREDYWQAYLLLRLPISFASWLDVLEEMRGDYQRYIGHVPDVGDYIARKQKTP